MNLWQKLKCPPWRTIIPGLCLLLALGLGYLLWKPGLDLRDGSHDRGSNAIWLGHGWLGGNNWFIRNAKTNQLSRFRADDRIRDSRSAVVERPSQLGEDAIFRLTHFRGVLPGDDVVLGHGLERWRAAGRAGVGVDD